MTWLLGCPTMPWRLRTVHAIAAVTTVVYGYGAALFHGDVMDVMANLVWGVAVALVADGIASLMGMGPLGAFLAFGGMTRAPREAMVGLVVWACLAVGGIIPGPVRGPGPSQSAVDAVSAEAEAAAAVAAAAAAARGYHVRFGCY
jgi:hypothetical protein